MDILANEIWSPGAQPGITTWSRYVGHRVEIMTKWCKLSRACSAWHPCTLCFSKNCTMIEKLKRWYVGASQDGMANAVSSFACEVQTAHPLHWCQQVGLVKFLVIFHYLWWNASTRAKQLGPPISSMEAYWCYANMTLTCTESFFFLINVVFCTIFIERSWCARLRRKLSASSNLGMWSGQWQFSTRITSLKTFKLGNSRRSFLKPPLFLTKSQLSGDFLGESCRGGLWIAQCRISTGDAHL